MIKRLFRNHRKLFSVLWLINIVMFFVDAIYPLIVGHVIDGIIDGSWLSIIPLVMVELVYLLLFYFDNCQISLKIEKMALNEKKIYFETSTKNELSDTVISARVDLIDDVIDFFEILIPNLCSIAFNIIVALICITIQTNAICFLVITITSVILFIFIVIYESKTFKTIKEFKDMTEKEQKVLLSRKANKYHKYLLRTFEYSRTLVKRDFYLTTIMRIVQLFLVLFVLFTTIKMSLTPGAIFTVVTYTFALNEGILSIPDTVEDIKNSIDSQKRIDKQT